MSQPGWYPDPAGRPGHYRYWNGGSWAAETTDAPATAPVVTSGPGAEPRRRRLGAGLALLAILVAVLVIVAVVVVRGILRTPAPVTQPAPLPTSSVSGGDDRSPDPPPPSTSPVSTPEPTAPSVQPPSGPESTAPRPTPSGSGPPCPTGDPGARSRHPSDDRVHGGDLSFPKLPEQDYTDNPMQGFTFAYDMAGQSQIPGRNFFTLIGVGALNVAEFESGPRAAAETVLRCILPTAYVGSPVTRRENVRNRRIIVDGAPGWAIRTRAFTADDPYSRGQLIEVIVLDTDAPEAWSFFYGAVGLDDDDRTALLDQTVRSLQVG